MANVKTYDLIQCSRLYPTVEGANNAAFLPYVDLVVQINGDTEQSYTVKENIQARFFAPTSADGVSDVQYSVTSVKFNGLECMLAPANLTVAQANNIYIDFPNYAAAPTGYTANEANAVTTSVLTTPSAYFERNFIDFMQTLFDSLGVNVDIVNSHPDWWVVDGFPSMDNFMLELYSSDTISFTMTETYNGVSRELMYEVDGTGATAYINGNDVTVIPVPAGEQPQFGDVYSINSVAQTANPIEEIECCPVLSPFYASLQNDCEISLDVDCGCTKITFVDNSNYNNGLIGHDPSFFNHRTITLIRPDGTKYIWSTDGTVGQVPAPCGCTTTPQTGDVVNELINPHWNSNNMFNYNFTSSDQDGIYTIEICTYPDWQTGIYYDSSLNNIVYRNGVIYKQVASSTSIDPATDTDNDYWIPLAADDDRGRYCSSEKIVVLCLSLNDCYNKLVEKALCGIEYNPCADMCDNKYFMKAMKVRITKDALALAVKHRRWDLAESHIAIWKSICCCDA
jgi:hypothetical protein